MDWHHVAEVLISSGWGCIGIYMTGEAKKIRQSIECLEKSANNLNLNVAVVVEQVSGHNEDIKELKRRLERVEIARKVKV